MRATDFTNLDIENMIASENDPEKRVFLIILNSINSALRANTATVGTLKSDFSTHIIEFQAHAVREEAIFNQGRGMWKIAALALAGIQILMGYVWMQVSAKLGDIDSKVTTSQINDTSHDARLRALEDRKHDGKQN